MWEPWHAPSPPFSGRRFRGMLSDIAPTFQVGGWWSARTLARLLATRTNRNAVRDEQNART